MSRYGNQQMIAVYLPFGVKDVIKGVAADRNQSTNSLISEWIYNALNLELILETSLSEVDNNDQS
jgi:hypothetical protein